MKVTIDLPDRSDLEVDERYAREALVATRYANDNLSVTKPARSSA
jgi:hypothetical protein